MFRIPISRTLRRASRLSRVMLAASMLILGFTVGVGATVVAQSGDDDQIYACVSNANGNVRVVGVDEACNANEHPLTWNIQGPEGPAGPAGDDGQPGEKGDKGDPGLQLPQSCPAGEVMTGIRTDGLIDCTNAEQVVDADGDGYDAGDDCNDANAAINPGATEVPGNGVDEDCNSSTSDAADLDGDTFFTPQDCDDSNSSIYPGAVEERNSRDDDCDGLTDEDFDRDHDGWFMPEDCDDLDPYTHPGAPDYAFDGKDQDCDGHDG